MTGILHYQQQHHSSILKYPVCLSFKRLWSQQAMQVLLKTIYIKSIKLYSIVHNTSYNTYAKLRNRCYSFSWVQIKVSFQSELLELAWNFAKDFSLKFIDLGMRIRSWRICIDLRTSGVGIHSKQRLHTTRTPTCVRSLCYRRLSVDDVFWHKISCSQS